MHVDFLTLACLRDELDALLGSRVQRILLPDDRSVGLELYAGQRFYLLLSAHSTDARVTLTDDRLRRGVDTETPLLLLLRKWLRGARLTDVTQPMWERMLLFHFEGEQGECRLVAEIMGRYSNLILVGPDGRVLEAVKRIGPELNRYRVVLPAHAYQMPPQPKNRRPPVGVDWLGLVAGAPADQPLRHYLTTRLLAVSPTLAREIVTRAAGDPDALAGAASPQALAQAAEELFAPLEDGSWQPHVGLDEQGDVIVFAPYFPRQCAGAEPAASISQAMERYFQQLSAVDDYAAARGQVLSLLETAKSRVQRALARLAEQLHDREQIETWRENGELLLAYQAQVPPGASQVTLPDYQGQPREIALDPTLPALKNAKAYFRRYTKARNATQEVPAHAETFEADLAHLEQLQADLALAESRAEIDVVQDALAAAGWTPRVTGRKKSSPGGPLRLEWDGFVFYVGRNAHQNEEVTFGRAAPGDLWLHVRGQPGAHVVVKTQSAVDVPDDVVQQAARLAAYFSTARHGGGQTLVDVTQRRFVRRVGGGHPGLVTYRNEHPVWVEDTGQEPESLLAGRTKNK